MPSSPSGGEKKPFCTFFFPPQMARSGGAGRGRWPRCPSPEVGRGARLWGQPGQGHFLHCGSLPSTLGTCASQARPAPWGHVQVRHRGLRTDGFHFSEGPRGGRAISKRGTLRTSSPRGTHACQAQTPWVRGSLRPLPRRGEGQGPRAAWGRGATTFAAILSSSHFRLLFPIAPPHLRLVSRAARGPQGPRQRRTRLSLVRPESARLPASASFRSLPHALTGRACVHSAARLPSPAGPE